MHVCANCRRMTRENEREYGCMHSGRDARFYGFTSKEKPSTERGGNAHRHIEPFDRPREL
eukprot:1360827-Amorphochlora_amoeboformis.AAC.1